MQKIHYGAADLCRRGLITEHEHHVMESSLHEMTLSHNAICKIVATPLPFAFVQICKMFVLVYVLFYPWVSVSQIGAMVVPVTFLLAFGFFGVDNIAVQLEQPFGDDPSDLALAVDAVQASAGGKKVAYRMKVTTRKTNLSRRQDGRRVRGGDPPRVLPGLLRRAHRRARGPLAEPARVLLGGAARGVRRDGRSAPARER